MGKKTRSVVYWCWLTLLLLESRLYAVGEVIPATQAQIKLSQIPENSDTPSPDNTVCEFTPAALPSPRPPITLDTVKVDDRTITVQLTGSTVLTEEILSNDEQIQAILNSVQDVTLTPRQFELVYRALAEAITSIYLAQGYLNSLALTTELTLTPETTVVAIPVREGRIAQIQLAQTGRLTVPYLCDRIALGIDSPFNVLQLEEQLRLMNTSSVIDNIEADLRATGEPGLSFLVVTVEPADIVDVELSIDNYSPPSLGSERTGIDITVHNVTGWGDEAGITYYRSLTGGSNILDAFYRLPLNPNQGILQFRATPTWTRVTQAAFDQFDITGNRESYELSYRQPLWRSFKDEFALGGGFRHIDSRNANIFLDSPGIFDLFGTSITNTFFFDQDYTRRDPRGVWFARSRFNLGIASFDNTSPALFNDTNDTDDAFDGVFFSWLLQLQRLQLIGDNHTLIMQGELQLTPDPLVPDYLFIIGGGQSVRGYRQNVRSGDNGFRFSIEDRITVARNEEDSSIVQIAPFLDMGQVWNAADDPNTLPSQTFLIGAGLGLILTPWENFQLRVDYGYPFIDLSDRGDNAQDEAWYFEVKVGF